MIITPDDIRRFRPLARNIADERIFAYIAEAETLDILPAIGADLYRRLAAIGRIATDAEGLPLLDEEGTPLRAMDEGDLPAAEHKLLVGGYYTDSEGRSHHFEGLRAAAAYLSYGRFVRNHSASVTPYGVVTKQGDESLPADERTVAAIASDAVRIGQQHLADVVRYMQCVRLTSDPLRSASAARRKIVCIAS